MISQEARPCLLVHKPRNDILNAGIFCSQYQRLDGYWKVVPPPKSHFPSSDQFLIPSLIVANCCGVSMARSWVLPCLFEARLQIRVYLKCLDRNEQNVLRTSHRRNVQINPSQARSAHLAHSVLQAVKPRDEPDGGRKKTAQSLQPLSDPTADTCRTTLRPSAPGRSGCQLSVR